MKDHWPIEKVEKHLGCSRITIYRLMRDGYSEFKFPKPIPRAQGVKRNFWNIQKIRRWKKSAHYKVLARSLNARSKAKTNKEKRSA